jgi:hypothetical protein
LPPAFPAAEAARADFARARLISANQRESARKSFFFTNFID